MVIIITLGMTVAGRWPALGHHLRIKAKRDQIPDVE
jgi:hypothetical protein